MKNMQNTPGTAGGPGGRDRTLAVKSRKTSEKSPFFLKKIKITQIFFFFLHLSSSYAKILGGNYFAPGRFPKAYFDILLISFSSFHPPTAQTTTAWQSCQCIFYIWLMWLVKNVNSFILHAFCAGSV